MNLKLLLTIFVALSLTSFAFAQQTKKKEDPKKYLEGSHMPGAGYKILFPDTKSKLEVSGFSNIDLTTNPSRKVNMPYFRFYINGHSDEKWSFNTRFDYSNSFAQSKYAGNTGTNGAYVPYFARAYTTYRHNENFSIDVGRIINFTHRFDVIGDYGYDVALGANAVFKMGDFYSNVTMTYADKSQNMADTGRKEYVTLGGRADYTFQLIGGMRLNVGSGFFTDMGYTGKKAFDIKPHFYLTTKNLSGLYVLNQLVYRAERKELANPYSQYLVGTNEFVIKPGSWENYFEVGMDILDNISADVYLASSNGGATNEETAHNIGLEVYMKINAHFYILPTLGMTNITKANGAEEVGYSHKVRLGYNF